MKLRQVTNHGLKRWRVDFSEGEAGQRVRKFFDSRVAAQAVREHGRRFARRREGGRHSWTQQPPRRFR